MRKDFIYLDNFKLKIISSTNTDNKVHNYMIVTTLKYVKLNLQIILYKYNIIHY